MRTWTVFLNLADDGESLNNLIGVVEAKSSFDAGVAAIRQSGVSEHGVSSFQVLPGEVSMYEREGDGFFVHELVDGEKPVEVDTKDCFEVIATEKAFDDAVDDLHAARNLRELKEALEALEDRLPEDRSLQDFVDMTDLKTFGEVPVETDQIWSWDDEYFLVTQGGSFRLIERDDLNDDEAEAA